MSGFDITEIVDGVSETGSQSAVELYKEVRGCVSGSG